MSITGGPIVPCSNGSEADLLVPAIESVTELLLVLFMFCSLSPAVLPPAPSGFVPAARVSSVVRMRDNGEFGAKATGGVITRAGGGCFLSRLPQFSPFFQRVSIFCRDVSFR